MESLGHYLNVQRKLRDISIADVSRISKVAPNWLVLLEEDAFDKLPGDTFTKGYLRMYAESVGLDPEDVILRYEMQSKVAEESPPPPVPIWRRRDVRRLVVFVVGMAALIYWLATRVVFVPQLTRHI